MEASQNPNPVERIAKTASHVIGRVLGFLPTDAPDYMSNHYDPLASPIEPVTSKDWPGTIEHWRTHHLPNEIFDPLGGRWDDMGNYFEAEKYCAIGKIPTEQWTEEA